MAATFGELPVGDSFTYCGATYEIRWCSLPDMYGQITFIARKSVRGEVVDDTFTLVRHMNDPI